MKMLADRGRLSYYRDPDTGQGLHPGSISTVAAKPPAMPPARPPPQAQGRPEKVLDHHTLAALVTDNEAAAAATTLLIEDWAKVFHGDAAAGALERMPASPAAVAALKRALAYKPRV